MNGLITLLLNTTAWYFLAIAVVYAFLLVLSWMKIRRYSRRKVSSDLPGVSFLIPAYNEESLIVETIQTYLSLAHEKKEIIVINDGSSDQTMRLLTTMYMLRKVKDNIYASITCPELKIVNVLHMGKAQALNQGLYHARYPLICTMDADTIPSRQGLEACLSAFASDDKLIAAGGVIQVMNSRELRNNVPVEDKKSTWLVTFQRIEYLRTFICERLGWSLLDSTILISGAFCMVKKVAVERVGGFNHRSITEDFDLIMRLRREYAGEEHRAMVLPVTTCYTQVPRTYRHLMRQRVRWQLGLMQTLFTNKSLVFNPRLGWTGILAVPYMWIVELMSPVFELTAFAVVPVAWFMGQVSTNAFLGWLLAGVAYNFVLSVTGLIFDRLYISRSKQMCWKKIAVGSLFIHFGYKQLTMWWRFRALLKMAGRTTQWGEKPREEIVLLNS
jgi:cellulose synthase/poly-beta-1,6-N-acetylglucosamine synthase-like glycosyltransferase